MLQKKRKKKMNDINAIHYWKDQFKKKTERKGKECKKVIVQKSHCTGAGFYYKPNYFSFYSVNFHDTFTKYYIASIKLAVFT